MACGETLVEARRLLDLCFQGNAPEANALASLLHIHRGDSGRAVVPAALDAKLRAVLSTAPEAGTAGFRAAESVVVVASFLDRGMEPPSSSGQSPPPGARALVAVHLIGQVLQLIGGLGRAPKDKAVRTLAVILLAELTPGAPPHPEAEAALLELAVDKVPAVRSAAVWGLTTSPMAHSAATQAALAARAWDPCAHIRALAMQGLRVAPETVAVVLSRVMDVDATVRTQLFKGLADQPAATVGQFGPAALLRLLSGLDDPVPTVRASTARAVEAWRNHLGGLLPLLVRCDIVGDPPMAERVARALRARFPAEAAALAREWLESRDDAAALMKSRAAALLSRVSVVAMREEEREEAVDIPTLLRHVRAAFSAATAKKGVGAASSDGMPDSIFLLQQLLHVLLTFDLSDEDSRREAQELSVELLLSGPLSQVDLGVLLLRLCLGLGPRCRVRGPHRQALEASLSNTVMLLVSDLSAPLEESGGMERFDTRLEELHAALGVSRRRCEDLAARKKSTILNEDFLTAHQLKQELEEHETKVHVLSGEQGALQAERDDSCSRILALVLAALRWSGSELRADPALFEALERVLKPFMGMKHLTEQVEQDVLRALFLFGSMDVATAKEHWQFMTQLVRKLGEDARDPRARQHAEVALSALGDWVRLHAHDSLDDWELLDAVRAVAVVPRAARALVPEAFCGMLLHAGTALLGAHLRSPVVELQWALAWVLVEAFAQPSTEEELVADELPPRTRLRVLNFFATLPRVLGDHGSALLVISVEAVAASGLWRRAVLLPSKDGGRTRWTHDFSWPRLFGFVTKVVDTAQLRLRLWRCALQLCVANPELASSAEVPLALSSKPLEDAPPRVTALLDAAIALGASRANLDGLRAKLGEEPLAGSEERFGLVPRAEAEEAERAFHEKLGELQLDVAAWVPPLTDAPKVAAPHVRMRASVAQAATERMQPSREDVAPTLAIVPTSAVLPVEGGSPGASAGSPSMRRQRIDWDQKASSPEAELKAEQEAKDAGSAP